MGIGSSYIVAPPASFFHKILEGRHYPVIASIPGYILSEPVIYLFSSVKAEYHIVAFPVGPLDDLVVYADPVCGKGKPEVFVFLLFYAPCVAYQLLYHLKIKKRLASEEIHLEISPEPGILHKEIQSPLSCLKAHKPALSLKFSLSRKAVIAV